ncbi:MAG: hypothetical protein KY454_07135 [Actinobacteria bacterium]|nr:hypothetical protein [Actinomycetota bacterium]
MPAAAVVSFRLGGHDGVSVEADKWTWGLRELDFDVRTVAGAGPVDVVVPGLERGAGLPAADALAGALEGVDVVVVENLLSLPLNPAAAAVVTQVLRGRPAIVRHHDLPWQRPELGFADGDWPPRDPCWLHVTINQRSRLELAARGIDAICRYNRFPLAGWDGERERTRSEIDLVGTVLLHPVRAIARKDVPAAVALAESLGATYWLTGAAEDGYEAELTRVLAGARCSWLHRSVARVADAYAASDAVCLTSRVEGFGNPVVESALARRPLALRRYPVAEELAAFGFRWFPADDPGPLRSFLAEPDVGLVDHNEDVARSCFGLDRLPSELAEVLERVLP